MGGKGQSWEVNVGHLIVTNGTFFRSCAKLLWEDLLTLFLYRSALRPDIWHQSLIFPNLIHGSVFGDWTSFLFEYFTAMNRAALGKTEMY